MLSPGQASRTANLTRRAAVNQNRIEQRNAQAGSQASAFDVWTHTVQGAQQRENAIGMALPGYRTVGAMAGFMEGLATSGVAMSTPSDVATAMGQTVDTMAVQWQQFKKADGVMATIGSAFALLTSVEQLLTSFLSVIPFPAFPALRVTDMDIGLPHAHNHPPNLTPPNPVPVPLPSTGPVIPIPLLSGANTVLVNGLPAARCGDMGLGIWCGGYFPMYEVFLGSSNVWVEGARMGRMAVDITKHCIFTTPKPSDPPMGPMIGTTITGSANVMIGGIPMPSLVNMAMGAAIKAFFKGVGKVVGALRKGGKGIRGVGKVKGKGPKGKPVKGKNGGCGTAGHPIDIVTGASIDTFVDYTLEGPVPLAWVRYYSSAQCLRNGPVGWGFRHGYQHTLAPQLDEMVYVDPQDREVAFPPFLSGEEESTREGYRLRRLATGAYAVTPPAGPVLEFVAPEPGRPLRLRYLRAGRYTLECRYDGRGRLSEVVDPQHRRFRLNYDGRDRVTEVELLAEAFVDTNREGTPIVAYVYDGNGGLVQVRDVLGQVERYAYDMQNRLTRKTGKRGYTFHDVYDEHGRCVHTRGDDGLHEVRFEYRPAERQTLVVYPDGGAWLHRYDENGTITEIHDPYGGVRTRVVSDAGLVVEDIDAGGNVTRHVYDAAGAELGRIDPLGHFFPPLEEDLNPPNPLAHRVPTTPLAWEWGGFLEPVSLLPAASDDLLLHAVPPEHRAEARRVLGLDAGLPSSLPGETRDRTGRLLVGLGADGRPQRRQYDAKGRVQLEMDAEGHRQWWEYDANDNVVQYGDRDGSVHRYEYASWNKLSREVDPLGGVTAYEYSSREQVTRVVDPGDTVSVYVYDRKDRLTEVYRNGRLKETYAYDAADNLVEKRDSEGHPLLTFEVDRGYLHSVRRLASGETHTFAYDDRGRVTEASTDDTAVRLAYDDRGRLVQDVRDGLGVAHAYAGEYRSCTTLLDRFTVTYEPAADGRLVVTDPTGRMHRFRAGGNGVVLRELANGTAELARYDAAGRCLGKVAWPSSAGASRADERWSRRFEYTPGGDLRRVEDSRRGVTQHAYDRAHRLVQDILPDGTAQTYRYDAASNLVAQPGLHSVLIGDANRMRQANGDQFSYNTRHHVSRRDGPGGTAQYTYNSLDMLVRCVRDGQTWTAQYDGMGRRIRKATDGRGVSFYWDGDRLAAEVSDDGRVRLYVYAADAALVPFLLVDYDGLDAPPEEGRAYVIFTDQVGVPVRAEDDRGIVVWQARVEPYGRVHVDPGYRIDVPLRFPGHYYDAETGLHYNRFRYYSPELGRYLQSDPQGQAGGINLYTYTPNPLSQVDVLGLQCDPPKNAAGKGNKATGPHAETPPAPGAKNLDEIAPSKNFREAAEACGMDPNHVANLNKRTHLNKEMAVVRASNPESLKFHGDPDAVAKPVTIKDKTAKTGPNAGLVVDEAGNPIQHNGKNVHGDYDMQGVYKQNPDGTYSPLPGKGTNDPDFVKGMNDDVTPNKDMFQHGANDDYTKGIDPETGKPVMGRNPDPDEKWLVSDADGNTRVIEGTDNLKQFYEQNGIPWPYNVPPYPP